MEVVGTADAQQRARNLRKTMTKPERLLWWALKANQTGFHFRKQHGAGPYVLDFYCDRVRLCVEVDGNSHDFTIARDAARDRFLTRWEILTVRVPAHDVLGNLQGVVEHIAAVARDRPIRQPSAAIFPKGKGRD